MSAPVPGPRPTPPSGYAPGPRPGPAPGANPNPTPGPHAGGAPSSQPGPTPGPQPSGSTGPRPQSGGAASTVAALESSVGRLEELDGLPVGEHVARYDALHGELSEALAAIDGV